MSPRPSKRNTDSSREIVDLKLNIGRLQEAMAAKGLSSAKLAELTGLSRSALSYFQHGKRQPSRPVLTEFADKLDVTVDYLLGRKSENESNPRLAELVALFSGLSPTEQDQVLEIVRQMKEQSVPLEAPLPCSGE